MYLAMACVGYSFDSFSVFLLFKTTTQSHENYVFLYPFSSVAISPKITKKLYFMLVRVDRYVGLID